MKNKIFSGFFGGCHCQGIAVDPVKGHIYYSFTTKLIKSDLDGNIIGSVDNIVGHLGCIDFNDADGRVYGSLEYKLDAIGKGILQKLGSAERNLKEGFYIAIFDVDKIDRLDMDAEKDGVMRAVYLKTVLDDYSATVVSGGAERKHAYGCSGIDGLTIGPDFGAGKDGKRFLHVCYGIYSELERTDNDHQVILQYEIDNLWEGFAKPLNQNDMHTSGPNEPRRRYFVYTGNTVYGVQNMEYDEFTGDYFLCVYKGKKPQFRNYPMYVIDGSVPGKEGELCGFDSGEKGLLLTLRKTGAEEGGISGIDFPHGSTGLYSFGNGEFYVSEHFVGESGEQATNVILYELNESDGRLCFVKKAADGE